MQSAAMTLSHTRSFIEPLSARQLPNNVSPLPHYHRNWSKLVSPFIFDLSGNMSHYASSGIGYGICQRLLLNFCGDDLKDALPQALATQNVPAPCEFTPTNKLCLILACRNSKKASLAREGLLRFLDEHICQAKKMDPSRSERMDEFRENLSIDLLELDLASVASTFKFCDQVSKR